MSAEKIYREAMKKFRNVRVGDDDDVPNSEGRTKISDSMSSDAEVDKPEL